MYGNSRISPVKDWSYRKKVGILHLFEGALYVPGAPICRNDLIIRQIGSVSKQSSLSELNFRDGLELLFRIRDRILAEVKGVNRVLYDLTPKPVATIEWE